MVMKKRSLTRSHATSIPKTISPMPALFLKIDSATKIWDILGMSNALSDALDPAWDRINPHRPSDQSKYRIQYAYIGGPDQFTVELVVEGAEANAHDIEWLYVRTHTGGQIKFMKEDQAAKALFAMADDDAYMFCQNDPCLECAFACKVEFAFFAFSRSEGLLMEKGKVVYNRSRQT